MRQKTEEDETEKLKRLEHALCFWEAIALERSIIREVARRWPNRAHGSIQWMKEKGNDPKDPIFTLQQIFDARSRLLDAVTTQEGNVRLIRDLPPTKDPIHHEGILWNLLGWCRSSRRVYRPTSDLQLLLQATSFGSLVWQDIRLPFEAYAVSLEDPIEGEPGVLYDTIILHRNHSKGVTRINISMIPSSLGESRFWRPECMREVKKTLERRQHERLMRLQDQVSLVIKPTMVSIEMASMTPEEQGSALGGSFTGTSQSDGTVNGVIDALAGQWVKKYEGLTAQALRVAVRIALGIAIYLSTLPSMRSVELMKGGLESKPRSSRLVISPADVCVIEESRKISSDLRDALRSYVRGGGIQVSPHFRVGYWSRPPGMGSDPEAEKTVWHNPTLVRKDLIQQGTLPKAKGVRIE